MAYIRAFLFLIFIACTNTLIAQTDSATNIELPSGKFLSGVSNKLSSVDKKLTRQTIKALKKFEKQERKLKSMLSSKDSMAAKEVFLSSAEKIQQLQTEFENIPDKAVSKIKGEYDAYLDTLQSTFKFLKEKVNTGAGKSKELQGKLNQATSKLNMLQGKLRKAEEIKKYLRERKQYLKQHLEKFGMVKKLKKLDKAGYYYTAYVKEYKEILKDRKKLEKKAMSLLYNAPFFKKFVEQNSQLASLFRLPGSSNATAINPAQITGPVSSIVQTRANVLQIMQTSIAAGGPNAMSQVRQQMQAGQAELIKLKDRIAKYGTADDEMPLFKPNTQKTKSFFKRLEYGANLQFGKAVNYLPATSDLALTLGYKLNDKSSLGIAAAYSIGLGSGWNNIRFTSNGLGLRSYIDWKIKGNFFVCGGYEQNYYSQFKNIWELKDFASWKASGLVGISKKVIIKAGKSIKIQLLYDFLSYQKMPVTQPFLFRTGINWK